MNSCTHLRSNRVLAMLIALVTAALYFVATTPAIAHANSPSAPSSIRVAAAHKKLPLCEKGVKNPDGSTRTHQDYALCMAAQMDVAIEQFKAKKYDESIKSIETAYFGWYENQLEPPSMTLAGNRKIKMEGRFTRVKLAIKTAPEDPGIVEKLEVIKVAVARDAMVLDGVLHDGAPESAGNKLLTEAHKEKANATALATVDFFTSMTLLLREGLEAMLVVVAIVLYLVKSGNKRLVKSVYWGAGVAIILSFLLAWAMKALIGGAGTASELIEGLTMFIAVAMLFYVSNWMLSKSEGERLSLIHI